MTAEDELAQLKKDLAAKQAKNAQLRQLLEEVLRRLGGVEGRLAKDSHNNNKPPSSDGLLRKQVSLRKKSEKKSGGQPGHPGHTFLAVERPDQVVRHRPVVYQHCQYPFEEVAGRGKERRQMHDLPEVRLRVCEHQVEEVPCPACGQLSSGGPGPCAVRTERASPGGIPVSGTIRANGAHLRSPRRGVWLSDPQGTLVRWVEEASGRLAATVAKIAYTL